MDIAGIKVYLSPLVPDRVPKIKLGPNVPLNDKFRDEFNAWLEERFGTKPAFYVLNPNRDVVVSRKWKLDPKGLEEIVLRHLEEWDQLKPWRVKFRQFEEEQKP